MPVHVSKDEKGCFAQWGGQAKYHFRCGNMKAEREAMRKAEIQGQAVRASEGQRNENKK